MGANTSYNRILNRVRGKKRTHQEYHNRIDGHKILLQNKNKKQVNVPMNSNSESPIYLCGGKDKNGKIEVVSAGIYKNHKCVEQIDLKFDDSGKLIPYDKDNPKSSHYHKVKPDAKTGDSGRKKHLKDNCLPIPAKYTPLLDKIENYNKKQKNE